MVEGGRKIETEESNIEPELSGDQRQAVKELFNVIDEPIGILRFVTEPADIKQVKSVLTEWFTLDHQTPDFIDKKKEIAERVFSIANTVYDRIKAKR